MCCFYNDTCWLLCVGATLEMFGSSANGFGSKSSDLDICLTIPDHDKVLFTFVLLCVQYDFETEL
jgi:predicted nucleotidyltransferase